MKTPVIDEEQEVASDREGKKVEIKEEDVTEVERTPLSYTRASGHYQQNPCSKWLNHTSVVEQPVYLKRKELLLPNTNDNVDYNGPGRVNSMYPRWTDPMSTILSLRQEEYVYNRKRGESGLKLLTCPKQKNTT